MRWETKPKKEQDPYRKQKFWMMASALMVLLLSLWAAGKLDRQIVPALSPQDRPCLIIDPGHGGIDGGAIAQNGVKESDLNLAIALKLRDLADFCGCDSFLTRTDDSSRTAYAAYSEHEDLVHRVELINQVPNGVLMSIHQNCYPTSQPFGAQVLYAAGEDSRRLGQLTHQVILDQLQPENRRVAEPASEKLYITANVHCPAALIECGFLSNLSDLNRLSDESYQTAFAAALMSAYLQYVAPQAG